MVHLSFARETFVPLPEGALWWPARRSLLVADLHLEKASWFAAGGQMLPPYDSIATLDALAAVAGRTGAASVWCLGDSFHDAAGADRLPRGARQRLAELTSRLDWMWVTGNHDPRFASLPGTRTVAEAALGDIVLRHEAEAREARAEISGHFHPKFSVVQRQRSISRRCFVVSDRKLILPAFGALAGGLDARDPAILAAAGRPAAALVPMPGKLLRFPLAA
jgi:uncharacterized protein